MTKYHEQPAPVSLLRSYLELLRLPNLFTAVADVGMGFLFVQTVWLLERADQLGRPVDTLLLPLGLQPAEMWVLGLLAAASAMLYAAGVVLNDVFDVELDRQERPERPLPSGRISINVARGIGWSLLSLGTFSAWGASLIAPRLWPPGMDVSAFIQFRPGVVATLLAAVIILYNVGLKRTVLGPLAMGSCRMLNVLLGMSVLPGAWGPEHWLVAGAIGVYITGVTWFARDEAAESRSSRLAAALAVMLAGIGLLALLPRWIDPDLLQVDPTVWYIVMGLVGVRVLLRCGDAIGDPRPSKVRGAVGQAILSLVVLDAATCFTVRGLVWGMMIVLLVVPATLLAMWIEPS